MESVIAAIIIVALALTGGLFMVQSYFSSQEALALSWQETQARMEARSRTHLSAAVAETKSSGAVVEVTLENDGETKLADFDTWDLIVQYESVQGAQIIWLPNTTGEPGQNEWSTIGIYLDAENVIPEVYDPGIANPGEQMVVRARLSPPAKVGSTNLLTIATSEGVVASISFTR